ncbi:hypothetical protein Acsp03_54070 [Actinomadura sp. NBRC 104412]|uniref:hypothetical protein n=1 Tax=Actinomadura sp. NBRC 104412 TaxID=3032203 RepID=UPI0024A4A1FA|nr:hypothetical protein [Actinomadura sp. NBRC 104412]GLZ07941.1 hypothetical protein Acsp03_54070 [Actinomadura sp. NBRC 104412]
MIAALKAAATGRIGLVGAAGTVGDRLAAYADAGLDEAVLVPATGGDPGGERTLTAVARTAGLA